MERIHSQEKQQFKKLFKQENIDKFEDRFNILEVFLQTERHLTADELLVLLNKNGYNLDIDFVIETLNLLCRYGFAQKNRFNDGDVLYEHRHLGRHHDHMICTKCKDIIEFQNQHLEKLQTQIASSYGFHMLQHKMEIYGICSKCLKESIKLMPLSMAKQGEKLIIKEFSGGTGARSRLLSMGLKPKDKIEVISNIGQGQLVISVDFTRYALGRGLASKIMVSSD